MAHRIEQLLAFFNENPDDPFNLYALAIEYRKSDAEKSKEWFERLIRDHPSYLPAYYVFSELLYSTGEKDASIRVIGQGLRLAAAQGDRKTTAELLNLKNLIELE
jgi:tetratricopeptide (TPR) repeat protein